MKMFNQKLISMILALAFISNFLYANGEKVQTDDKLNPTMLNTLDAVNILNLSGKKRNGDAVTDFIIVSLPFSYQGVLYLADGETPIKVNQSLTLEEANGLRFNPNSIFVGNATFHYVAVEYLNTTDTTKNSIKGNEAIVTIPVVSQEECECEEYTQDIPIFSNTGLFLIFICSMGLGLFLVRREPIES